MKFVIDPRIFEKFPSLNIGVVVAKGIDNSGNPEELQKQLGAMETKVRENYDAEMLSQNPKIDAWRKAYSSFGAKPKENRSSVEALYRTVLKGISLRHINKVVDVYNLISLKHMVPVGGEDMGKIRGNIALTFAEADEPAVLLLGDKEPRAPHAGEVIYKDGISAICRRWNWREAERTKLTEETKDCVLVIEGLFPVTKQEIENATAELSGLVSEFCSGRVGYSVLDRNKAELEL